MSLWYVWRKPSTNLAPTLTLSQNRLKRDSTWPTSPRSFIECHQYYFWAYCTYICIDTSTMSKRNKTRFHTTHVTYEFHRVRSNLFMSLWYVLCKLCTYLVSRLALSPNGPNRAPPGPRHVGVPSGASKMIYKPMVCLMQTKHLSCTNANIVSKPIETRFYMTHVT
jgi:hypothetical protein